jgi:hypothetical protein
MTIRNAQAEANRQAWALIRPYDVEVARWLRECPHALVVATVVQLNLTAVLTLLLAFDTMSREVPAHPDRSPFAVVLGKALSVLGLVTLGSVVAQSIVCGVQIMAHGDSSSTLSWALATVCWVPIFATSYVALWIFLSASAPTPRLTLFIGAAVLTAFSIGRLLLRAHFNHQILPSMLDTSFLSGRWDSRLSALAIAAMWSSASLFGAATIVERRRHGTRRAGDQMQQVVHHPAKPGAFDM